ncbi:uncharacterized protein LOC125715510 isoform X6 [Brienomyrus brachyistius]|uniref:uncharacterized protein LOC125715510 isoform X6 n=1 Tax=Brienomyrus brachyistius TaxID=42636 RepID=UPI0020B22CA5|nr:uncharacterized protein LOC125715510 isoform X6 [Brienomyrus brachyistius]
MALIGWGCGKVTLGVILFMGIVGLLLHSPEQVFRPPRWTHDGSHLRPISTNETHPFLQNYWYRYVYDSAKKDNLTNCYVCTHMPSHADGLTIYGKPMNKSQAKCAASFAGVGYQHDNIKINDTDPYTAGLDNGVCAQQFWIDFAIKVSNISLPLSVHLNMDPKTFNHSMCYDQMNGTHHMGNTTNCAQILVHGEGAPVNISGSSNGTYWVQGVAWLCGPRAYFVLPYNWYGVCAPIFVSDHTFLVSLSSTPANRRRRFIITTASLRPHDSVWGSDVPQEFKHWSTDQKVLMSLFPWVGTAKNTLRLETIDYRLGLFINNSIIINEQQNGEIDAIKQMVIQNRMVLDILTAAQGGVCVLLNNTCCTYIPDNVHSPNMTTALDRLRELQKIMTLDPHAGPSWLNWFLTGSWWQLLLKFSLPILVTLLFVCCCFICIIPCLRSMIQHTFSSVFLLYTAEERMDLLTLSSPLNNDDDVI